MREEGLGSAEAELIRLVREQPGISQREICERLNMDKGAVARRAVNLERKGYLTRKENPADGRSQLLYPSGRADSLENSGEAAEKFFYDWLLEVLSVQEREAFCDALRLLGGRAEQESADGYPNVCERMQRPGFETNVPQRRQKGARGTSAVKPSEETPGASAAEPAEKISAASDVNRKRRKSEPDV
ncbi:MAG: MarR family transcriptional regulator, partial [Lachnospiraceae bacterium]|nr:MarR family transcriptional regulator [Lachnospiraceae bacterium]